MIVLKLRPWKPDNSCDNFIQKTGQQISIKLKALGEEGTLVIGEQKIQDLYKSTQQVAVNSQACCIASLNGKIGSQEFVECQRIPYEYGNTLKTLELSINEVDKAKKNGDSILLEQMRETIFYFVDSLISIGMIKKTVPTLPQETSKNAISPKMSVSDRPNPQLQTECYRKITDEELGKFQLHNVIVDSGIPIIWKVKVQNNPRSQSSEFVAGLGSFNGSRNIYIVHLYSVNELKNKCAHTIPDGTVIYLWGIGKRILSPDTVIECTMDSFKVAL